jgi:hypothetical protein
VRADLAKASMPCPHSGFEGTACWRREAMSSVRSRAIARPCTRGVSRRVVDNRTCGSAPTAPRRAAHHVAAKCHARLTRVAMDWPMQRCFFPGCSICSGGPTR